MNKAKGWTGKTRGGVLGYRIFIWILKFGGIGFAYFILRFVALYFMLFGGQSSASGYFFFKKILGKSKLDAIASLYQSYYSFGQSILDRVYVLANKNHPFKSVSNGIEVLEKLALNGRGAILISAHLGNWEIAGQFLKKLNVPVNIVLFDGEYEKIKELLKKIKVEKNFNVIPVGQDFSHLLAINKALKAGEFVCIHGDRCSSDSRTKRKNVNFMGKKADFPLGPFSLASKLDAPYSFVFAIKQSNYCYEFFASSEDHDHKLNAEEILLNYVNRLEYMVRKYPEQWYNYYSFWSEQQQ